LSYCKSASWWKKQICLHLQYDIISRNASCAQNLRIYYWQHNSHLNVKPIQKKSWSNIFQIRLCKSTFTYKVFAAMWHQFERRCCEIIMYIKQWCAHYVFQSSPPVFSGILVSNSLIFRLVCLDDCLSVGHCLLWTFFNLQLLITSLVSSSFPSKSKDRKDCFTSYYFIYVRSINLYPPQKYIYIWWSAMFLK
jgi:hypothetical protein